MSHPPPHHQVAVGETTDIRIFEYKYEVIPIPLKKNEIAVYVHLGDALGDDSLNVTTPPSTTTHESSRKLILCCPPTSTS